MPHATGRFPLCPRLEEQKHARRVQPLTAGETILKHGGIRKADEASEVAHSDDTENGMVVDRPRGEVKRDLSRRQISMIGLAGMIASPGCCYRAVRTRGGPHTAGSSCIGNRIISCLGPGIDHSRPCRRALWIPPHDPVDSVGDLDHWQAVILLTCGRELHTARVLLHPACPGRRHVRELW